MGVGAGFTPGVGFGGPGAPGAGLRTAPGVGFGGVGSGAGLQNGAGFGEAAVNPDLYYYQQ